MAEIIWRKKAWSTETVRVKIEEGGEAFSYRIEVCTHIQENVMTNT